MDTVSPVVNLLVVRSRDIHRAVKFYQCFGLEFELHSHGRGPLHYAAEIGGLVFEIYPEKEGKSTLGTRMGFCVKSVDETVARLAEFEVEVLTQPADSKWGRRAVVRDLDGHAVELTAR